jgi:hypothetical protein
MSAPIRGYPKYASLPSHDTENGDGIEASSDNGPKSDIKLWLVGVVVTALVVASLFVLPGLGANANKPAFDPQPSSCTKPVLRREWRQLNRSEQASYTEAVNCLNKLPSKMHPHGRLSDDFPWSHRLIEHYGQS